MMNVKNGHFDKSEKIQSWRMYSPEFNKPKFTKFKPPSLSPKSKENTNFSPSKFNRVANSIIGLNNISSKRSVNNVLPSSSGYIYNFPDFNHYSRDKSLKANSLDDFKTYMPEESKESGVGLNSIHDNTFSYKDPINIHENIEINNLHNYSYVENIERYSELTLDLNVVTQHLKFLEVWVDLEISLDNKQLLNAICNKFLKDIDSELIGKEICIDIFSSSNLNRTYNKIIKVQILLIYVLKLIIGEFCCFDVVSVRSQIKRIIISFSEMMALFVELFIFKNLTSSFLLDYKILTERISKLLKGNFSRKHKKNEDIFHINRLIETSISSIKSFINTIFNNSLFNAIHSASSELLRSLDKITTQKLANIVVNNLIYGILRKEEIRRPQKLNNNSLNVNKNNIFHKIKVPFLPPPDDEDSYTLVLDLDETLIHFFYTPAGGTFFIRPGSLEFLTSLSEMYEIVIFTAGMKDYADNILDLIDPQYKLIKHRLYRHHTTLYGEAFVKDLLNLGRNLAKTIIIDNIPENFVLQPNNGLSIKTWTNDIHDTQLIDLNKILKDIYFTKVADVRPIIKAINEEVVKNYKRNVNNPYCNLEINNLSDS